ncbi:hypothetical protein E4P40_10265 [Blastococcus sp. CT_GayMR20]|uniref:hypothetical protein n=1 Tax=Blastococcus sp. CT_GayMR20 TaxID=2559609 RepID=UPI001073F001|nr:hypothetical protein [Blastococcus sp. CT_GayMR20]TFV88198.1 hypothetical protein E4P40_10265 [Blastococcus sp. CT_GayMR20]
MFVQVILGRTSDPEGLRAAMDRWVEDLRPGAVGWLGTTGGVTDDGRAVVVARFESEDAARQNSERPEQGEWWAATESVFDGEVTFLDSSDVVVDLQGDPDQAGFVQVMRGRTSDPARARQLMTMDPAQWSAYRPDVLGSLEIGHDDGAYTMILYFTSEAEAREGERTEVPLELRATMEEMGKLAVGETEYFDLREPLLR